MASGSQQPIVASKSINISSQSPSSSQVQTSSFPGTDSHSQRRVGGSGSFGFGASTRNQSSGRNNQPGRKQHKNQRRPRLADEDAIAESVSMRSTTSRKGQTSITHLMNFSLPPRPQYTHQGTHTRQGRRNPTWGLGSGYHAVDKARYVHANYRFIVNPNGEYKAQAVDADVHLDWNSVLQILASAKSQDASCPICLSHPVAPRMAKCGHIFCLPCLMRYMQSVDDTKPVQEKRPRWKSCPLCWDHIYISETRPVRWFTGQESEAPTENADVVLRLVVRQPGNTLALPRDGTTTIKKEDDIPWYFAAEVMDYARVMKGSADYMLSQFDEEIEQLRIQEKEDELMFEEGTEWTTKAVNAINEAKEKIKDIGNPPSKLQSPPDKKLVKAPIQFSDSQDAPDMYFIQHAAKSGQSTPSINSLPSDDRSTSPANTDPTNPSSSESISGDFTEKKHIPTSNVSSASQAHSQSGSGLSSLLQTHPKSLGSGGHHSDSPYYFYQSLLHYYLSSLDIRILKAAFGDYSAFPTTILPRVEHVSTGHIVDDDLRKRIKYLAHLPYGCEVGFLECDWTDVVPLEVLDRFKEEIDRRRKRNKDKQSREDKERLRAEKEEEDKRWAHARRRRPEPPRSSFPDDFYPLPNTETLQASSSMDMNTTSTSPPWPSPRTQGGSGFASLASPSTSPVAGRTVWGTNAVVPTSPQAHATLPSDNELAELNDGWLQGWEKDLLHEDEQLVAQVQAASLGESSSKGAGSVSAKKKKGKKITLMSTSARRGA